MVKERARVCASAQKSTLYNGVTIFPGDEFPVGINTLGINMKYVKESAILSQFLVPKIIACVAYQSTVENETTWHFTDILLELGRKDESGTTYAIRVGEDVPVANIYFTYSFERGVIAN